MALRPLQGFARSQCLCHFNRQLTGKRIPSSTPEEDNVGPFNPHAVARGRILSYMKWTVLKFVEILAEWGDSMFREDTLESFPEALLYYTQASHIMSPKLQLFDRPAERIPQSYHSLSSSSFMTEFESSLPWNPDRTMNNFNSPWL